MTTVTICARFTYDEKYFIYAVEALLRGMDLKVKSTALFGGDTFISAQKQDINGRDDTVGVVVGELPGVIPGPELTISLPAVDVIASSENLPPAPAAVNEVALRSFSDLEKCINEMMKKKSPLTSITDK